MVSLSAPEYCGKFLSGEFEFLTNNNLYTHIFNTPKGISPGELSLRQDIYLH